MTKRIAVINESEPGIVYVSTEALCALMARAGGRQVQPAHGGDLEFVFDDGAGRPPHPDTMAGR